MQDDRIVTELGNISEAIREFNINYVASQAPPVPGRLTKKELHSILKVIQDDIERRLEMKTGWGRNEVKQIVAQAMWNMDLGYQYKEE